MRSSGRWNNILFLCKYWSCIHWQMRETQFQLFLEMVPLNRLWYRAPAPPLRTIFSRKIASGWNNLMSLTEDAGTSTWHQNYLISSPHQTEGLRCWRCHVPWGPPACKVGPDRRLAGGRAGAWCGSSCPRWRSRTWTTSPDTSPAPGWSGGGRLQVES